MKKVHLIDDESIIHDIFKRLLNEKNYELIISENRSQAKRNHSNDVDVVILDLMIPGTSGIDIFKDLKKIDPDVKVIFLTAYGTIESAIEAIKMGAVDYLQKPFNNIELKHKIDRVIKENSLKKENKQLKKSIENLYGFKEIIGKSKKIKNVLTLIKNVADSYSTVLITGESGTGKELVARAIHFNSKRKHKPYLTFNSSNFNPNLLESTLFGHKKGSFTDAHEDKTGLFEEADGGTLFLDEIGNLTPEVQAKILRVIQEKEIQPIGSNKVIKVDVRIIAATNENLEEKVKAKEFREDLFYRINIVNIHLPPLRERKEDIPLLVEHFIKKHSKESKYEIKSYSEKFIKVLMDYHWPGNIRELENSIIHAMVLSDSEILKPEFLPQNISKKTPKIRKSGNFNQMVDDFKRSIILDSLEKNNWVQKDVARELDLKPNTLSELMKRLNIKR